MKQIHLEQRSQGWLDWRRNGVTASDASVLLGTREGVAPYKTQWQLWAEKSGVVQEEDLSANPHMQRGIEQEDDARNLMEQALGDAPLLPVCGESDQNPILRASFDGITKDGLPVELKCPCETVYQDVKTLKDRSDGYRRAFVQVQFQMLVADATHAWLCFYFKGSPLLPVLIPRDERLMLQLQSEAEDFWQQVLHGDEPDKDSERDLYRPQGLVEQAQWYKLSMVYRQRQQRLNKLKEELESGKARQKLLQQELQQLMGEFRTAESDGLRVCQSECCGTVDYQKTLESLCQQHQLDMPDLEPFRRKSRHQVRVTVLDNDDSVIETAGNKRLALNPTVNNQSFYF